MARSRRRELAGRLRDGRYRQLPQMAHQPYLEQLSCAGLAVG